MAYRVEVEKLYKNCNPGIFEFETTEAVPPLEGILGQERAVRATDFGLRIKRYGYNIFLAGHTGTGKISYARAEVEKMAEKEQVPDDWCYLYNFKNPGEPLNLNLPAGMGSVFSRDIDDLLEELNEVIPKAFNTDEYERQKGVLFKEFQDIRSTLMEELNKVAQENGFMLKRTGTGYLTPVPLKDEKEISDEEFSQLPQEEREVLEKKSTEVQLKSMEIVRKVQNEEKLLKEQFRELEHKTGLHAVGHIIAELKEKYKEFSKVEYYLDLLQEDVLENLADFRDDDDEKQMPFPWLKRETVATKYVVNLVIDNKDAKGAPVVVESNPTYYNLVGRVEYENKLGMVTTDFTMIKGGAFHRANGGYLILQAKDLLLNFQAWEAFKRILKTQELRIETIAEQYSMLTMATLKPEPIPLNVKVIIVGNPYIYQILYRYDDDFRKLFKIKADFDIVMDRSLENMTQMANFISTHCQREGVRHFDRSGVARMVEYSSRLAEHQDKLCTCFNEIVELLYEADAWAEIENVDIVGAAQVEKAIAEKVFRSDKYEKKLLELVEEGQLLFDFTGEKVGQVNGLAILDLGDFVFGKPTRITASTYLGRRGILNIERESKMSGRIHDKGVLIISGYLGQKYAQDIPLTLSASLCFEQSYEGVEGDSASSAELYTLLSSIAEVPLRQSLAVTGSVNQKGEIQPVGGISRKIEGYFAACKIAGLNGEQGVLIPHQNMINLMLDAPVLEAVQQGKFHIYAVKTVEEGMEILTGMPMGERQADGTYPEETINFLVGKKLREFNDLLGRQGREQDKEADKEPEREEEKEPQSDPHKEPEEG